MCIGFFRKSLLAIPVMQRRRVLPGMAKRHIFDVIMSDNFVIAFDGNKLTTHSHSLYRNIRCHFMYHIHFFLRSAGSNTHIHLLIYSLSHCFQSGTYRLHSYLLIPSYYHVTHQSMIDSMPTRSSVSRCHQLTTYSFNAIKRLFLFLPTSAVGSFICR
jgi:hypothetical protein